MNTVRLILDALHQVERMAQNRGQKMVFTACSCCGNAMVALNGNKGQRDVLVQVEIPEDGVAKFTFPNEPNEKVKEALIEELALAHLQ